jgi:feruloyl-CoA synthase
MSATRPYESVSRFARSDVVALDRPDGVVILRNVIEIEPTALTLPDQLRTWAAHRPTQVWLSERRGGVLTAVTYADALIIIRRLASRLARLGLDEDRPLAIVAANGVNHALLMLAATSIGVPVAVVTPAYVQPGAAPFAKFEGVVRSVRPGLVVADAVAEVEAALAALGVATGPLRPISDLSWLDDVEGVDEAQLAALEAGVGPDTLAKLLFTSGSTGSPKSVVNTQRMMVSNMEALARVWTFLEHTPPEMVDWLPWSHTFGGNCCFNLALFFGGSLHIDSGKPLPALVGQTVEALREHRTNIYFNVPSGYEALLPTLEGDPAFAAQFFSGLEFVFNAGAALPASIRQRIQAAAEAAIGRSPPVIGAWGSTETAPFATVVYFDTDHANNLGVPLPGVEIKLVPSGGRTELRVRGPNVTPGYWRDPAATAAAFDEEGFYRIGDAGRLADPSDPSRGILFDGRIAENFKLGSGTWVNVGSLRLAVIAAARPLISDAVVAGEGRDALGLLVFPNEGACRAHLGETLCADLGDRHPAHHPAIVETVRAALAAHNAAQKGGSTRVAVFALMTEPANPRHDEITEKGYINQRAVLARRADAVTALYETGHRVEP